jgi:hypothetical protein
MMSALLASLALSTTAHAGADLAVDVVVPGSVDVDVAEEIVVEVRNTGNRNADDVSVSILLPETATSPTVHVLGDLSGVDTRCSLADTELLCSLGRIRKGRSKTIRFDLAAPWAAVPLDIDAEASTTSSESNLSDNADVETLDVVYVDQPIAGPAGVTNRHCTGSGLTVFYECELYPSSISSHDILLESDGSITFAPGLPSGYTGSWWQDTDDHLHFEYEFMGQTRLVFDGNGVGSDGGASECFEGISTFPGSTYNSAYQACFREL